MRSASAPFPCSSLMRDISATSAGHLWIVCYSFMDHKHLDSPDVKCESLKREADAGLFTLPAAILEPA